VSTAKLTIAWEHDAMDDAPDRVRLDTWLWAARLLKTRPLAAEAVRGGRVHVNGHATKPGRPVGPGDRVELTTGLGPRTLVVRATSPRRLSAPDAALLYDETEESRAAREAEVERRPLTPDLRAEPGGRPTKRDRRRLGRERDRS
jgi:ribosome-associated heat shock protein Hsp15